MFSEHCNNIARIKSNLKTVLGLSCASLTHLRSSYHYYATTSIPFGECWAEAISLWNALQSFQRLMKEEYYHLAAAAVVIHEQDK